MRLNNTKGYSLAETLVAVGIFTFLGAGLMMTLTAGNQSWNTNTMSLSVQREARKTIDQMSRDLRVAENIVLTQSTSSVDLTFSHPTDGSTSITWLNSGGSANQVLRTAGANTRIIARNITVFSFTDSVDNILLTLTASGTNQQGDTDNFQLIKKIAKRS